MEDRYLFRGKRIDNGEWVYGAVLFHDSDAATIFNQHPADGSLQGFEVDVETICQCTGLKDKNGKLIWENDIVKDLFSDTAAPIKYGSYPSCFDSTKVEHIGFYVDWSGKYNKNYRKDLGYWIHMVDAEVVGNALDNPEFLEESYDNR